MPRKKPLTQEQRDTVKYLARVKYREKRKRANEASKQARLELKLLAPPPQRQLQPPAKLGDVRAICLSCAATINITKLGTTSSVRMERYLSLTVTCGECNTFFKVDELIGRGEVLGAYAFPYGIAAGGKRMVKPDMHQIDKATGRQPLKPNKKEE